MMLQAFMSGLNIYIEWDIFFITFKSLVWLLSLFLEQREILSNRFEICLTVEIIDSLAD
jgi:hypothetical protein